MPRTSAFNDDDGIWTIEIALTAGDIERLKKGERLSPILSSRELPSWMQVQIVYERAAGAQ